MWLSNSSITMELSDLEDHLIYVKLFTVTYHKRVEH